MDEERIYEIVERLLRVVDGVDVCGQARLELQSWGERILEGGPPDRLGPMILETLVWSGAPSRYANEMAQALYGENWKKRLASVIAMFGVTEATGN